LKRRYGDPIIALNLLKSSERRSEAATFDCGMDHLMVCCCVFSMSLTCYVKMVCLLLPSSLVGAPSTEAACLAGMSPC
jgi:hypothetical protein